MRPDRRLPQLASIGALLACSACNPEIDEPAVGCEKLADCPLGEVCDATQGQCIPEPADRILGKFKCEVVDAKPPQLKFLGSELIGHVGKKRTALSVGTTCWLSNGALHLIWSDFTDTFWLLMDVDGAQAAAGGRLQMGLYAHPGSPNSGSLVDLPRDQYVAITSGGFIALPPATVGQTIEGYVDLQMIEVIPERGIAGIPCPRGMADCGRDREGQYATYCLPEPSPQAWCTRDCEVDSECEGLGGAICAKQGCAILGCNLPGTCLQPCDTTADCIQPFECKLVRGEPRRVCY